MKKNDLVKVHDFLWEIPKSFRSDMRVPARVYSSEEMLEAILEDRSLEQLINVATLPGIVGYALAMPDVHEGYGFPVGGVAAFSTENGIISPGGIGYDINCGVRLLKSSMKKQEIAPHLESLSKALYKGVPSGVGQGGPLVFKGSDLDRILREGVPRLIEMGYGEGSDLSHIESEGVLRDADPSTISPQAKKRGESQLGTMGAGNHFVEVGFVEKIFDQEGAKNLGLSEGQITVLIHTGSRGLGHQVATDYIRKMVHALSKYELNLPDRELACAPFSSKEGQEYWKAMSAAANFAWSNRQLITWEIRKVWSSFFGKEAGPLSLVYDVSHNIAKVEEYVVDGKKQKVVVHRKGATRAFPNQPVLIPGSMGTFSYVLLGEAAAGVESFGSTCHGAGRRMSRTKARKEIGSRELTDRLRSNGISVAAGSSQGLVEEAPEAYKDVNQVVEVVDTAHIAKRVARLKPLAVVKG